MSWQKYGTNSVHFAKFKLSKWHDFTKKLSTFCRKSLHGICQIPLIWISNLGLHRLWRHVRSAHQRVLPQGQGATSGRRLTRHVECPTRKYLYILPDGYASLNTSTVDKNVLTNLLFCISRDQFCTLSILTFIYCRFILFIITQCEVNVCTNV